MNSSKGDIRHPMDASSNHRIRLLINIDDENSDNAKFLKIPYRRFVYGLDINSPRTVDDFISDIRQMLIHDDDKDAIRLELYLRNPAEYFIPGYSSAREVFQNNDEILLKLCRIFNEEMMDDYSEERPKNKKRKKDKVGDVVASAIVDIPAEETVVEKPTKKKRKKKQKPAMDDFIGKGSDHIFHGSKSADIVPENDRTLDHLDSSANDSSKKRKRPKTGSLYDNAKVVRNERTGKIQHVYFGSSDSEESDVEAEKSFTPKDGLETERLTSDALAKAKTFNAIINLQTTCENLNNTLDGTTENGNGSDRIGSTRALDMVPISVRRNIQQNQGRQRKGQHYTNVSLLLKKVIDVSTASSSVVLNDAPQQREQDSVSTTPIHQPPSAPAVVQQIPVAAAIQQTPPLYRSPFASQSPIQTTKATLAQSPSPVRSRPTSHSNADSTIPSWMPSRLVEDYPLVKYAGSLRVGDRLAYKVMELDVIECTPGVSDWKIGELISFEPTELELGIRLVRGEARCDVPQKFRVDYDEDEEVNEVIGNGVDGSQLNSQKIQEDVITWNEIIEARLLNE